jgi:hypothetical protein
LVQEQVNAQRVKLGEEGNKVLETAPEPIDRPGRAKVLYEKVYCARGRMENLIKDMKLYTRSDRTSCHRWEANSALSLPPQEGKKKPPRVLSGGTGSLTNWRYTAEAIARRRSISVLIRSWGAERPGCSRAPPPATSYPKSQRYGATTILAHFFGHHERLV